MDYLHIDPRLDHHPDVLAAGFAGATVFQAVLRAVAEFDKHGRLPKKFGPAWLARRMNIDANDVGMPPERWVELGIARCVLADLLLETEGAWEVPGWEQFYTPSRSGAERQAAYRKKRATPGDARDNALQRVTEPVTAVTPSDASDNSDATPHNRTPLNTTPLNRTNVEAPPAPKQPTIPVVLEAPANEPGAWTGEDFWQWFQWKRQKARLVPERPPRLERLSAWWSATCMAVGDVGAIQEAVYRFSEDKHWQAAQPALPFAAFMSQWQKYMPQLEARHV